MTDQQQKQISLIQHTEGKSPQHDRTFMDKLALIMSNPSFQDFFNQYFQDWSDIKAVIMIMQLYSLIDQEYQKLTGGAKLPPDQIVKNVQQVMMNTECRALIVDTMSKFMNPELTSNQSFRQIIMKSPNLLLKSTPPPTKKKKKGFSQELTT